MESGKSIINEIHNYLKLMNEVSDVIIKIENNTEYEVIPCCDLVGKNEYELVIDLKKREEVEEDIKYNILLDYEDSRISSIEVLEDGTYNRADLAKMIRGSLEKLVEVPLIKLNIRNTSDINVKFDIVKNDVGRYTLKLYNFETKIEGLNTGGCLMHEHDGGSDLFVNGVPSIKRVVIEFSIKV